MFKYKSHSKMKGSAVSAEKEIERHLSRLSEKREDRHMAALSQHLASLPKTEENAKEALADRLGIIYGFIFRQKKHVRKREALSPENRQLLIKEFAERILRNHEDLIVLLSQVQSITFTENLGCWQMACEKVYEEKYGLAMFKSACELAMYVIKIDDMSTDNE